MSDSDPGSSHRYDVAIIGGGSAAEALLRELDGTSTTVVMFEPRLVGGECPFYACMPSKSVLHSVRSGHTWDEAVARRDEVVDHLDDSGHHERARELGATVVSAAATITGSDTVRADEVDYSATSIVIAVGASVVVPDISGLDTLGDRMWTSEDALTTHERPDRLVIIGGGVIGSEIAQMYAGLGCDVTMVDTSERPAADLHPEVSRHIVDSHDRAGITTIYAAEPTSCTRTDAGVRLELADRPSIEADIALVAVGRRPDLSGLGLGSLGLDHDDLTIDENGRIAGADSLWIMGDAAGREQYTHVANRHAAIVANHLVGDRSRSFGESVVPACIFIDPPVFVIGATEDDLSGDADIVWSETDLDVPRVETDELPGGFITLAGRRSTGTVVAAHGIGPRFDELSHALVIAIDGEVPIGVLRRTIQPFPTIGEVLTVAFDDLAVALDADR
ncbi:MAG: NAD(P)/FAD-dependent oxidoreductase [Ilumatobacter sp.]|uniref:dihydrolipoyl dehydrogenase family protein n=1 Tax=Ilumatobacter sp. TaxID=1967498 RepID=UPI003C782B74